MNLDDFFVMTVSASGWGPGRNMHPWSETTVQKETDATGPEPNLAQECHIMKKIAIAAAAIVLSAIAGGAFAQSTSGLTREQVRADLVNAQRAGVIPTADTQYPPTPDEVAQNKATYQIQFGKSTEPQRWATGVSSNGNQG